MQESPHGFPLVQCGPFVSAAPVRQELISCLRRDQIEPSTLGVDWANCLVIAVRSPVELSYFAAVGENLSFAYSPKESLAGVLLSHLPQVVSEGRCLMIEGRARLRPRSGTACGRFPAYGHSTLGLPKRDQQNQCEYQIWSQNRHVCDVVLN